MIEHRFLTRVADAIRPAALDFADQRVRLGVDRKGVRDFASDADRALEELIRNTLHEAGDHSAILGEEGGGGLDGHLSGWAIDPVDGTSNFLRGLPLWGISLGYLERGVPVAGLLMLPELGITLTAGQGIGVRKNGGAISLPPKSNPVRTFAVGENDFEPGGDTDARAASLRDQGYDVVRYRCAVFALAGVALGWLNGYVEHGCGLWDAAGGAALCREAGAQVTLAEVSPDRWSIDARWPDE